MLPKSYIDVFRFKTEGYRKISIFPSVDLCIIEQNLHDESLNSNCFFSVT